MAPPGEKRGAVKNFLDRSPIPRIAFTKAKFQEGMRDLRWDKRLVIGSPTEYADGRPRMTRNKYEFPTEWSICPDANQDERTQPPVETQPQDQETQPAEPQEPRAFAAGGFMSLPR